MDGTERYSASHNTPHHSSKRIRSIMATITHTTPQDHSGNSTTTTTTITIRVPLKPGQTTFQERKAIIATAKAEPMAELVERVGAAVADGRDKRLVRELKAVARERYLEMGLWAAAGLYR